MKAIPAAVRPRRFRPPDLEGVMTVERASFGRWAYSPELIAGYARRCPELFLVICDGGAVVAYSVACRRRSHTELVSIAVRPDRRRSGLGQRLLDVTIRRLRRAGEKRLRLVVKENNQAARRFYERRGFLRVRVLPAYYEDGRDGVLMALDL